MAQAPLVVEPDVGAVHTQVEHVVEVLAARDPRVERQALERLFVQRQTAAAHVVAARQARAAHGFRDHLVEGLALLPEMVVPLVLALRQVRPFRVEVEARLGQDGNALLRELAQAVHGLLQKVGVVDDLVVVQEHDRVEPEHVGQHQAEVAHRAVPRQADLLLQLAQAQLLHALLDERELRRSHNQRVQRGVAGDDPLDLLDRLHLDGRLAHHEHENLPKTPHLLKRRQQTGQLARLRDGRRVVVRREHAAALSAATGRDECGDDDNRVHARPSFGGAVSQTRLYLPLCGLVFYRFHLPSRCPSRKQRSPRCPAVI